MRSRLKESRLEKKLTQAVKRNKGLSIKLPASLYRGIPDRLILLPGKRIYFIELKAEKGRPSVAQLRFVNFLQNLGFPSDIIQGENQLTEFICEHIESPDRSPSI